MRLPFLQIESDLVAHGGAEVAQLAGCSLVQAIGHITLLRAWAVSRSTDEAPPDGLVVGESSGRRIEAAAQWTGEKGALLRALIDAGHVVVVDGDHRILHLEPYQKAWERNANAKARMANAREQARIQRERSANMSVSGANEPANQRVPDAYQPLYPVGKTQTQMEDVEEKTLAPDAADAGDDGFALTVQTVAKERRPSAAEKLYFALEASRRKQCEEQGIPFVEQRWDAARVNKALGSVAKARKGAALNAEGRTEEQARFEAAWGEYLADPEGAAREPAWSIGWFMSGGVRSRYESRAVRSGP